MQFHKITKVYTQLKCPLYIDFIISNNIKELTRETIFLAFSVTTMVLFKHTVTTAKEKLKNELLGPRAQLKQTLITTMVT